MLHPWLPAALFALAAWSLQRLLSKRALTGLGTRKFYLLSAVVSLVVYLYLLALSEGPASVIVPLVSVSPALAGLLAIPIFKEPAGLRQWWGIGIGLVGAILLAGG